MKNRSTSGFAHSLAALVVTGSCSLASAAMILTLQSVTVNQCSLSWVSSDSTLRGYTRRDSPRALEISSEENLCVQSVFASPRCFLS